jgi:hypothetical protein
VESKLGPLGTSATHWPIVPALGDCEHAEFGGMNGRGNRSTRRKPEPTPLCPPQILLDQTWDWTRAAAVGSQRLTASAMARPPTNLRWRKNYPIVCSAALLPGFWKCWSRRMRRRSRGREGVPERSLRRMWSIDKPGNIKWSLWSGLADSWPRHIFLWRPVEGD